ncbi:MULTISPECIES: PHP domain-containing protein [unclassified Virgibacillus]|uniref:PHP domain-containing protein n=1 Tax=unclassified Virgibacillus TaxID=2620237 RepID=UPI000EF55816|nr:MULTISPECIES: PHP domain-containing protein [unclassified Virgibacillus]MDY7046684.1 PHP domain-containing protein [Virgibacillus sp. M23]
MTKTELHIHSTFSDGGYNPAEIINKAAATGIQILSFTDHDAIGAYDAALRHAEANHITLIPGIELNTDGEDGELHILGYFFDPHHRKMFEYTLWRKQERTIWTKKINTLLNQLGYLITFEGVTQHVPGEIIVRTHIAEALAKEKYFTTAREAYEELLIKGKPAFVERAAFSAKDAIALIHDCGGEAYLAHPGTYSSPVPIDNLISYGIDGIEVYHSKHSEEDIHHWLAYAKKHELLVSGGSDYHGTEARNSVAIGSVQLDEQSKQHWMKRVDQL